MNASTDFCECDATPVISRGSPGRPRAFSCKRRGFCPSCGARRMAETAALLSDEVFPDVPLRQWVISFPFPLRYLFAAHPDFGVSGHRIKASWKTCYHAPGSAHLSMPM